MDASLEVWTSIEFVWQGDIAEEGTNAAASGGTSDMVNAVDPKSAEDPTKGREFVVFHEEVQLKPIQ